MGIADAVRFPVTRIVLAFAALALASILWQRTLSALLHLILGRSAQPTSLYQITLVLVFHFVYVGYVRIVERRRSRELS